MSRASELMCEFTQEVGAETPEEMAILYEITKLGIQVRAMIDYRKRNA